MEPPAKQAVARAVSELVSLEALALEDEEDDASGGGGGNAAPGSWSRGQQPVSGARGQARRKREVGSLKLLE